MPPEVIIVPFIFLSVATVLNTYVRLRHKEKMARLGTSLSPAVASEMAQRMARLEEAVDSIAVEIERISEGQRFVTKLLGEPRRDLAERSPMLAPGQRT